ncbi:NACHT domain-containing protein [Kutzneria viridogrisea]|uniref:Energy-coupling factor transporter ATP-binding protein EcfA2 n=1 Tax=Kutzneria viridogrisea TaxID=47990 RepID=A0ABR6BXT5_9PSEU|nr:energy-coupling factor transporter ATP-binding protein EcfA2 [Kutzneria viridogrisea]
MSISRQRAVVVACVLIAVLATIGLVWTDNGINPTLWLSTVTALFIVLIGVLDPWMRNSASTDPSTPAQLASASTGLAQAVSAQLRAESEVRELSRPYQLPLTWSATPLVPADNPAAPDQLSGSVDAVVPWFRALPGRRVVVLGPAGSGKSSLALLLALGLLEDFGPHDQLPVLLPLGSWNPRVDLRTWITQRLREDYPALRNTELYGSYAAELLVDQRRVLPVLDAFDEIPANLRVAALQGINKAVPPATPLVLTSRPTAYGSAVSRVGPLRNASVIELDPVEQDALATVLRGSSTRVAASRWEPLLLHLRHDPDGPLAETLSSPLMVWLARTRYADVATNPTELLDPGRFPNRASIEEFLLDGLVTAVFPSLADEGARTDHLPATSDMWEPEQARRWLVFLATRMQHRELPWWELRRLVHRYWLTVLGAVSLGLMTALSVGLMVALVNRLTVLSTATVTGSIAGTLATAGTLFSTTSRGRAASASVRFGAARSMLVVSLISGTAVGLVFGALFGADPGLISGLSVAIATALRFSLGSPVELSRPPSAEATMSRDRALVGLVVLVFGIGVGSAAALLFGAGRTGMVWLGFSAGALLGFVLSAMSRNWWWFSVARAWLAMRGRLPYRLLEFLEDAHQLGVLRQVGARYQFRHARVQEHLAQASADEHGAIKPDKKP